MWRAAEYCKEFFVDIWFGAVYIDSILAERVGAENMKRAFAADYYYYFYFIPDGR